MSKFPWKQIWSCFKITSSLNVCVCSIGAKYIRIWRFHSNSIRKTHRHRYYKFGIYLIITVSNHLVEYLDSWLLHTIYINKGLQIYMEREVSKWTKTKVWKINTIFLLQCGEHLLIFDIATFSWSSMLSTFFIFILHVLVRCSWFSPLMSFCLSFSLVFWWYYNYSILEHFLFPKWKKKTDIDLVIYLSFLHFLWISSM